jgi:hypothetical protein
MSGIEKFLREFIGDMSLVHQAPGCARFGIAASGGLLSRYSYMEQQDVVMQEESVSEINHFDVQVEAPMSRHVKTKKQTWKLPIPGDIAGHGP